MPKPTPIPPPSGNRKTGPTHAASHTEKKGHLKGRSVQPQSSSHGRVPRPSKEPKTFIERAVSTISQKIANPRASSSLEEVFLDNGERIPCTSRDVQILINSLDSAYSNPNETKKLKPNRDLFGKLWNWILVKIGQRQDNATRTKEILLATAQEFGEYVAKNKVGLDDPTIMGLDPTYLDYTSPIKTAFIENYIKTYSPSSLQHLTTLLMRQIDWSDPSNDEVTANAWLFSKLATQGHHSKDIVNTLCPYLLTNQKEVYLAMAYLQGLLVSTAPEAQKGIRAFYDFFNSDKFKMPTDINLEVLTTMIDLQALHGKDENYTYAPSLYNSAPHFLSEVTNYLLNYIKQNPTNNKNLLRNLAAAFRGFDMNIPNSTEVINVMKNFTSQLSETDKEHFIKNLPQPSILEHLL